MFHSFRHRFQRMLKTRLLELEPMAIIGVDSSGKAGQPPIFMVAVRQKEYRCIHLSPTAEHEYRNQAHWKYKLTAALMFKAIEPIFMKGDSVEIDEDFVGRSRLIEST